MYYNHNFLAQNNEQKDNVYKMLFRNIYNKAFPSSTHGLILKHDKISNLHWVVTNEKHTCPFKKK